MKRILCDTWFQKKNLWGNDPGIKLNIRITAVNEMYGWLNQRGLLKSLSFVWQEFVGGVAFGMDVENLLPYKEEMLHSGIKDAELAVREIFDEVYQPCRFCGAIDLSWPMLGYRDEYGCVSRSWEANLVRFLDTPAADAVWEVLECDGPVEAVKELFRRLYGQTSNDVKEAA